MQFAFLLCDRSVGSRRRSNGVRCQYTLCILLLALCGPSVCSRYPRFGKYGMKAGRPHWGVRAIYFDWGVFDGFTRCHILYRSLSFSQNKHCSRKKETSTPINYRSPSEKLASKQIFFTKTFFPAAR